MSDFQATTANKQSRHFDAENEEEIKGGLSYAPPKFQLTASPPDPVVQRQTEERENQPATDFDSLAQQIHDAFYTTGESRTALAALAKASGSLSNMDNLRCTYHTKYQTVLAADIRKHLSEKDLKIAISYLKCDPTGLAELLYASMKGAFFTDEVAVDAVLTSIRGDISAGKALKKAFKVKYGEDLRDWIRGDFSGSAETKMLNKFGNEYDSMEDFTAQTGRTELGKYEWLKADRENNLTGTFDTAMANMTYDKAEDILLPFEQVRDYYIWVSRKLDAMGHESRWVKGALYLVDELTDTYDEGAVTTGHWALAPGKDVIPLLEDLNVGIVNFAITQFHRLMHGDLKDEPLKGTEAYNFDRQFIENEQGQVAFQIYDLYKNTGSIKTINRMFNGTGVIGNSIDALSAVGLARGIPTFPTLTQADLTNEIGNFGQKARTDIPLFMLYPEMHRETNFPAIENALDEKGKLPNSEEEDPMGVYKAFMEVNQTILNKEW